MEVNILAFIATALFVLVPTAFAGWFHYHKAAPKLAWFQDVESMLKKERRAS